MPAVVFMLGAWILQKQVADRRWKLLEMVTPVIFKTEMGNGVSVLNTGEYLPANLGFALFQESWPQATGVPSGKFKPHTFRTPTGWNSDGEYAFGDFPLDYLVEGIHIGIRVEAELYQRCLGHGVPRVLNSDVNLNLLSVAGKVFCVRQACFPPVVEPKCQFQIRPSGAVPDHIDFVVVHRFSFVFEPLVVPLVFRLPNIAESNVDLNDKNGSAAVRHFRDLE